MALRFQSSLPFSRRNHASKPIILSDSFSNPHTFSPRLPPTLWRIPGLKISLKEGRDSKRIRIGCNAKFEAGSESHGVVKEKSVSVVLLAGGQGKRMGVNMPKQYLPLLGQPIALYSFHTFSHLSEVKEIVVVCDPSYKDIFEDASEEIQVDLKFAFPGKERQDSVFNGLQPFDWLKKQLFEKPESDQ